nr:hypothetical protein [Aeromicrobium sp.]
MSLFRPASVLLAAVLVAATAATDPARAATEPTTLAVDGTVRVVVVDHFGEGAHAEHLHVIETADGAEIPVDLPENAPANARFEGELVVRGEVAADLAEQGLLPRAGSTIDEDTRAGRAAIASAEQQEAPLQVAESTVAPVTAAAVTAPAPHQVYVAVMDNRGTVEETDPQVAAIVQAVTSYWTTESNGAISSFATQGAIKHFSSSAAGTTETSCGMASPGGVWGEAAALFPGVSFATSSRNHLVVAMADECGDGGIAGIASVGVDFSSGGRLSLSMGDIAVQVGVHEVGHTFGLGHANLDTCPSTTVCEYYDLYSPMALAVGGAFKPTALGTSYRTRLGATAAGESAEVTLASGQTYAEQSFSLTPRGGSTGLRGLRVTDPSTGTKYTIDWRNASGRDAGAFYGSAFSFAAPRPTYPTGVVVEREGTSGAIHLMTRSDSAGRAIGSYGAGNVFSPSSLLRVTVGAIGSTSAAVTVRLGLPPIQAGTPTISGSAVVDQTVTAAPGAWEAGTSYAYDWRLDNVPTGVTTASYTIPPAAAGKSLTVSVTGSKTGTTPATRTSAAAAVAAGTFTAGTVSITGSPAVGETLAASTGTWTPTPSFTYAWSVAGYVKGTASTFTVPADADGKPVTLTVTGTRPGYTAKSVAVSTANVTTLPPVRSSTPTISGAVVVGGTVVAEPGSWADGAALTYDWRVGGVSTGVTGRSYDIPATAAGQPLTVVVTGEQAKFADTPKESAASVVQAGAAPAGSVSYVGPTVVDATVTAASAGWPAGTAVSWQWEANGVPVAGATSVTFRIPPALRGAGLRVVGTGTRPGYATTSAASVVRGVLAARIAAKTPRIYGTKKVGKTLKVNVGSWSPRPSYRYQWYANGKKITSKGTKSWFKLTSKQKGKKIKVRVTGRKTGYVTVAKTSSSTRRVAGR